MISNSNSELDPVERLADSFLERYRAGERPSVEEYVVKYPELADEIGELLPALVELEQNLIPEAEDAPDLAVIDPTDSVVQLGDFRIIREVGRGGMGVVYEAEQVSLGRRVALKVLSRHLLLNEKHARRFDREARAAARLHHTNIVPVFGVGEQDGVHYYVMQFINGLGLDEVLVELKRLRDESAAGKVGQPVTARQVDAAPVAAERNADVASRFAYSLLTGQFEKTQLMDGGGESVQQSAISDQPSAVVGQKPEVGGPRSKSRIGNERRVAADTTLAQFADTAVSSGVFALPGQSDANTKAPSQQVYWQSIARIGVQAAEALQYAHDQGIVHRDIKPGNLLLDARGSVWVTDFGLAKATDQQDLTHTGDVLGTLRYMAPEQFDGRADARSDVYGLGLTLYELLALQPAFDETDRPKLVKQVTTGAPVRLRLVEPRIPRDLETIVHKAIERDPAQRYETVGDLAADLQRYLGDEPIRARRVSLATRFTRWCKRNPAGAAVVGLLVLGLCGSTAVAALFAKERNRTADALAQVEESAALARRHAVRAEEKADEERHAKEELEANVYLHRIARAHQELLASNRGRAEELLDDCPVHLRSWEWNLLKRLGPDNPATFEAFVSAAFSPDGRYIALQRTPPTIDIINAESGATVRTLTGIQSHVTAGAMAFCPDAGESVLAAGDMFGRVVKLWNTKTGEEIRTLEGHGDRLRTVVFSPDGRHLAAGSVRSGVRVWDWRAGEVIWELPRTSCSRISYRPDGRHLAIGVWGQDADVTVYDATTRRAVCAFGRHPGGIEAVVYSPDGKDIATSGQDGLVRIWNEETAELIRTMSGHAGIVHNVAFTPDGRRLASAGWDKTVKIWDTSTGNEAITLRGHHDDVMYVGFSPSGNRLVSVGFDAARIWNAAARGDMTAMDGISLPGHSSIVRAIAFSPDGHFLATAGSDRVLNIWEVASLGEGSAFRVIRLPGNDAQVLSLAFSPDSRHLVAGGWGSDPRVWDVDSAKEIITLPVGDDVGEVAYSPDGHTVASYGPGGVKIWDMPSGALRTVIPMATGDLHGLALSPDGLRAATGQSDTVELWDLSTAARVSSFSHAGMVWSIAYSPDSQRIASASSDQTIKIWDVNQNTLLHTLNGHTDRVMCVTFSPDGRLLASASGDSTVRIWNAKTGQELMKFSGYGGYVWRVAFSPDGRRLASSGGHHSKGDVRIWDVTRLDLPSANP